MKTPTTAAESSETSRPESNILGVCFDSKLFVFLLEKLPNEPRVIPSVEKLAKDVRKTVRTPVKWRENELIMPETSFITTNPFITSLVPHIARQLKCMRRITKPSKKQTGTVARPKCSRVSAM
jgi:hypothetical protein